MIWRILHHELNQKTLCQAERLECLQIHFDQAETIIILMYTPLFLSILTYMALVFEKWTVYQT